MTTQNLKRKKNNHLKDQKRTRPSKASTSTNHLSAKQTSRPTEEALSKAHRELEIRIRERTTELMSVIDALKDEMVERKRAEAELRESERKYRELADFLPEMVYEADENGRIVFANRCAFETFGYTQEHFDKGLSIFQMIIPEHREEVKENFQMLLKGKKIASNKYTALRKDGSTYPVIASASLIIRDNKPIGVRGVVVDITEYKQAEEALQESEERYRDLIETARDVIFTISPQGVFTSFNRAFETKTGWSINEWVGKAFIDLVDPNDVPKVLQRFKRIMEGQMGEPLELRIRTKYGAVVHGEFVASPQVKNGKAIGFLGIARDITERRLSEEALRRSEEEARRLAQENAAMAEIGQIISSTLDIEEVYERFAEEVHKLIPFDGIAINIINQKEGTVTIPYVSGIAVPGCQLEDIFPLEGSVTGEVVRTRSGVIIQMEDKNELQTRFPTLLSAFETGLRSIIAVPLISKGQVIGAMHFRSSKPNAYSDQDLMLAKSIGSQVAGAIANAQLYTEHKQAENALCSERNKFRGMLLSINDGVDIVNKDYIIEFQNELLQDRFGDKTGEKCYAAYMGLEEPCHFCSIQEAIKTGSATRVELVGKDSRNYELNSSPFTDVDGEVKVIELVRDITEHKQAEEALRQESSFRNTIIEHATEGLCVCHEIAEFPYVAFTVWNDRMIQITGYTMDEINRLGWYQTMYPDPEVRARAIERMARMRQDDDIRGEDWEITRADGEKRVLSISTSVLQTDDGIVHVLALMHDMTERKNAEEALRESEEKYRGILENIADGYYEVDLAGNLTFFNDSVIQLLGYTKEELMGKNNREYMDRENAEKLYQTYNRVYRTGVPSKGFDWEIIRKDGTRRDIEASVSLVKNSSSQLIGFHGIVRDITEHKKADIALHKLNEILQIEIAERKRAEERLEKLNECMLGFGIDSDENINQLVALCGEQLQATCALYNRLENGMLHSIGQWHTPPDFTPKDKPDGHICYDLIQGSNSDIRIIRNLQKTDYAKTDPNVMCYNLKTYVGMPVSFEGTFVGSLCVVYQEDYLPGEDDKKFLGIIASAIGVEEERKRSDEALRESESKLRIILDSIQAGILIIDPETHTIVDLNPTAAKLIGAPKEKIVESICHQYICPAEIGKCPITDLKQDIENKERILLTANGEGHPIIKTVVPIVMGGRKYLLETFIDITERKRAEDALRESEERYRTILENIEDGYYEVDLPGKFTFFNDSLCRMLGYSRNEMIGMGSQQYTDEENHKKLFETFNKVYRTGEAAKRFDWEVIRKDGEKGFGEVSVSLIKDSKGQPIGFRGIARDITERKRAEGALRDSEERFRVAAKSASDLIWEWDILNGRLEWFGNIDERLGYNPGEFPRTIDAWEKSIHPEEHGRVMTALDQHLKTHVPYVEEYRVQRKDGTFCHWIDRGVAFWDEKGNPFKMIGACEDITERKRSEESLEKSEMRFMELFNEAPVGYFEYNIEGLITNVNRTYLEMLGYMFQEMIGKPVWKFIVEEEVARQQILGKLAGTMPPARGIERTYRRKDGTKLTGLIEDRPLKNSVGKIIGMRSTIQDISDRKRAEEEMMFLQEQLRQSQKMEAIGILAGGIAHDFNNLLTIINGYSQLSLRNLKESDPFWGSFQEIQKAAQRATDLTRKLLAFSRRQILDLKVLDTNTLLRDLEKMLRRIIGEDIELVILLTEDLGKVKIDPGQFEQMILNLVVNSRDAMPSGGKLIIETVNTELDEEYARAHISVKPGPYVQLSISDTGVGISSDVKEKVFDPFFTTKDKSKGTGLGLSTVYGIVKQSGGNIWVYSEPGHGTTFKIYLPRVEENLDAVHLQEVVDFSPGGSETVLLVEDEASVRNLAYRILCQQGYTVLEAADGDEALSIAQERIGKKIDLLLTDVVMPKINGKELADRIQAFRPELKILFTSGYTGDAIVHHGVLTPGTHFLQKPFSFKSLSCKVREVLDQ